MKIAILYICTGQYHKFWNSFYASSEEFFCSNDEKQYFVFTDSKSIDSTDKISIIYQDNFGWPFNTLYRYRMFLRIQEQLANFDYIVFFNANCQFMTHVKFEEFFGVNKKLVACLHPGFFNKEEEKFTYERRKESIACVQKGKHYFAGGICGGKANDFLNMSSQLLKNIEQDLDNGVMAIWHDESYWNAYLNNNLDRYNETHFLSPAYLYPEGWKIPFEQNIMLKNKSKYIDLQKIKGNPIYFTFTKFFQKFKIK